MGSVAVVLVEAIADAEGLSKGAIAQDLRNGAFEIGFLASDTEESPVSGTSVRTSRRW